MSLTDFIKNELYPSLFNSIDIAFPEMNFTRSSKGWDSSLGLKGRTPKNQSPQKTRVLNKSIAYINEQGEEGLSLVDYVMSRDGIEFIPAVKKLADLAGLKLPEKEDFNEEEYKAKKRKEDARESLKGYFKYLLLESKEGGKDRDNLLKYLTEERGYNREEIGDMELGYKPNNDRIEKYLKNLNYSQEEIKEAIGFIPDTNKLAIPIYTTGKLIGFTFRASSPDAKAKYYNTPGLDKSKILVGISALRDVTDLVIVEGYLDTLIAQAKGFKNVVALGSASLSKDQIKEAVRLGAKSFTLCLDIDETGQKNTATAIENILSEGVDKIYIVTDLQGCKDPDELIKEKGVDAFRAEIYGAIPYYEYKLDSILDKYNNIVDSQGALLPRDVDNLQEDIIKLGSSIPSPIDRDKFKEKFLQIEPIKELGISRESLDITIDNLTSTREKEEQRKELNNLLNKVKEHHDKGETKEALELLDKKVKDVRLKDKGTEFSSLLIPNTEEGVKERLGNKPHSLETTYSIGGEPLLLPSGAISVFTAPTSHGKTTLLLNLALDVANKNSDKNFYFFSYEEDKDSILTNAFNIYQGEELSKNNNNRNSINYYFSTGSKQYIQTEKRGYFEAKKDTFFKELIDTNRLNIQYSNYDSDTLADAIRYLAKNSNAGGVFIDYIQLLNLPQGKYKTYSRQEEIKEICIALKDLAVETGLPIVLGAQFNRQVVNPMKIHATNIGEAGDIERIANLIVGFWNNNFAPQGELGDKNDIAKKGLNQPDTLYSIILKNRGGRVGLEEALEFNGNTGKISNQNNTNNNIFG